MSNTENKHSKIIVIRADHFLKPEHRTAVNALCEKIGEKTGAYVLCLDSGLKLEIHDLVA